MAETIGARAGERSAGLSGANAGKQNMTAGVAAGLLDAFGGRKPTNMFEQWVSLFPTAPLFGVRWAMLDALGGKGVDSRAVGGTAAAAAPAASGRSKQEERTHREQAALSTLAQVSVKRSEPRREIAAAGAAERLRVVGGRDDAEADDLTRIKGVGPRLAALLRENGVRRFAQIAAMDAKAFAALDAKLGTFRGRWRRDKWAEQARKLSR